MTTPDHPEPPSPGRRRYGVQLSVFALALWGALVIALLGVVALMSNTEVISAPGYSVTLGPAALAVAALSFWLSLAPWHRPAPPPRMWRVTGCALITLASYLAALWLGAALEAPLAGAGVIVVGVLIHGYAAAVCAAAGVAAGAYFGAMARRYDERGRPRWSWEDEFDA